MVQGSSDIVGAILARPEAIRREVERRRLISSLHAFVVAAWHILEPASPFLDGWHIRAICQHLEAVTRGEIKRLIINMPPRHGKSLLVSVFWPAWVWTTRPASRWIFSSYAQSLSSRDARKFRRLISSPWYRETFGAALFSLNGDQNTKLEIENDRTGHRIATSVGASGTGKGGEVVAVDDPHKVGEAESRAKREAVVQWWREEMSTRGDSSASARVLVQQRVHVEDLTGVMLASAEDWVLLRLPARFEGDKTPNAIGFVDPRTDLGELLWPAGCPASRLDELEAALGSPYAIAGQLQQRPAPRGGGLIKDTWLTRYTTPPPLEAIVISADFSHGSTKSGASYHVFAAFGLSGKHSYLLDVERFRAGFPEALTRFKSFCNRWPAADLKLVENKAAGRSINQSFDLHGIDGIWPVEPPQKDKVARLEDETPYLAAGYLHVPEVADWIVDFVFEATNFPRAGSDDQVDVLTQFLHWRRDALAEIYVGVLGG